MKKILKNILRFIVLVILLVAFVSIGRISYSEIQATKAKEYVIKELDFTDWNVFAIHSIEYVYEEDVDCSTLWLKKCTDNKDLYKRFTFMTTEGETFKVTEYKNGEFENTYKKDS